MRIPLTSANPYGDQRSPYSQDAATKQRFTVEPTVKLAMETAAESTISTPIENQMSFGMTAPAGFLSLPLVKRLKHLEAPKIRFGVTEPSAPNAPDREPLTEAEQLALSEQLYSPLTSNRTMAIRRLIEEEKVTNPTVLRNIARYLKYNDIISGQDFTPRVETLFFFEKNPSIWALESLIYNSKEVSSLPLQQYAATLLTALYAHTDRTSQAEDWLKRHLRMKSYDTMMSSGNFGNSSRITNSSFLAWQAPKEEAALMLYLLSKDTSYNSSGYYQDKVAYNAAKVLMSILVREHGIEVANVLLQEKERVGDQSARLEPNAPHYDQMLLFMLQNLPQAIFQNPPEKPKDIEKALTTLIKVSHALADNEPSQSYDLHRDDPKEFAMAISLLMNRLNKPDREPFKRQIMDCLSKTPRNTALLSVLMEQLSGGRYTTYQIFTDYAKTHLRNSQPGPLLDIIKRRQWYMLLRNAQAVLSTPVSMQHQRPDEFPMISYGLALREAVQSIGQPAKGQFSRENSILHRAFPTLENNVNKGNPTLWQPKYDPPVQLDDIWNMPAIDQAACPEKKAQDLTNATQLAETLETALEQNDSPIIRGSVKDLTGLWVYDSSQAAFDVLCAFIDNPTVAELFQKYFYEAEHAHSTFSPQALQERKMQQVNKQQFLWLYKHALLSGKLTKTGSMADYRKAMVKIATIAPERRSELLQIALEVMKQLGDDPKSPRDSRGYAADTLFQMLKFGVPKWVFQQESKTLSQMLSNVGSLLDSINEINGYSNNGNHLSWKLLGATESSMQGDREFSKDFDLLMTLAIRLKHTQAIESNIGDLSSYFSSIRDSSYSDEPMIIKHIRRPEVIQACMNTENRALFNAFLAMAGWYKIFEAIPALVETMENRPELAFDIAGSIRGEFRYHALPELEEIAKNSRSPQQKALAQGLIRSIQQPELATEALYPFPQSMDHPLMNAIRRWESGIPNAPTTSTPSRPTQTGDNAPQEISGHPFVLPPASDTENPTTTTGVSAKNTDRASSDSRDVGGRRFVIIGYDNPYDASLSPIERLEKLSERVFTQNPFSTVPREQVLQNMAAISRQIGEAGIGMAFATPGKTRLAKALANTLIKDTSLSPSETLSILEILTNMPDNVATQALYQRLTFDQDEAVIAKTLTALENLTLGASEETASIPVLDADRQPTGERTNPADILQQLALKEDLPDRIRGQALTTLISQQQTQRLLALGENEGLPDTLKSQLVNGLGELWFNDPAQKPACQTLLTRLFEQAPAGSALKQSAIFALGNMVGELDGEGNLADAQDAQSFAQQLISTCRTETPSIQLAALTILKELTGAGLRRSAELNEFLSVLTQSTNFAVQQAARNF